MEVRGVTVMVTTSCVAGARTRRIRTAPALLVLLLLVGCGGGSSPGGPVVVPSTTPAATVTTTVTEPGATSSVPPTHNGRPTAPAASALPQLRNFLAAAGAADAQLRAAAVLVNGGVRDDRIVITDATETAVQTIDTSGLAQLVPAGAPVPLVRAALGLVAGLNSRERAFVRVVEYGSHDPLARDSQEARDLLSCLGNGSVPARRFAGDLAATGALAARTPAFAERPPGSRAAAELAVRGAYIWLYNSGCDECGGYAPRPMTLVPVRWFTSTDPSTGSRWDGTVGDIPFRADYAARTGWIVNLNAC